MAEIAVQNVNSSLLTSIAALKEHFGRHFDRGWLAMIIDDLPIDFTTIRQIRQLLMTTEVYPEDLPNIRYGAEQLLRFSADLRRYLLPVLRERLGVSRLLPARPAMDDAQRVHRQLLCLAFPYNLARLDELTHELIAQTGAPGA
jgi:hypothetical protein